MYRIDKYVIIALY